MPTYTGKEIADTLKTMLPLRTQQKLYSSMFASRCDIAEAIKILSQDINSLAQEIENNKNAIQFLKGFKLGDSNHG